jgi:NADH-quinone oxidoreductase subunit F
VTGVQTCALPICRTFKATLSGAANPVVHAADFHTPLSYEGMREAGTGLGAGGFAVYDDSACMVAVAEAFSRFLYVESCGQCPPCKVGSGDITAALHRLEAGQGSQEDINLLSRTLRTVTDANRCYLGTEEQLLVSSVLQTYPDEVAAHLETGCPSPGRKILVPKLEDIVDGKAVYDERQDRKRPDWTFDD